ncbi:type II toxin-antitoxin system Phd/YefM family antitoxin [Georgenia sp. TF02-10]|uniref:type II toxin-antitoxin system Phd/YefM family antitoxin n=1 Tax=Georgenia sp. TF02-10 TaxID=2917725 RepID=UPI001FA80859|nr:type II toxin-antitoxin system Phd/YefM family antitoxin [Georgenia sp. TF02-10]UNX56139.1 type II toxin-antitoxin system Phd/YefM family antitoxin [Georgenia sp. TF02-10]
MPTVPISAAAARLDDLVDQVVSSRTAVTITRDGRPAVVLVSAEEWEALQETLFWLSLDGVRADVDNGRAAAEAGGTLSEAEVRARLCRPAKG